MIDPRIDDRAPGAVVLEPREVLNAAVLGVTLDGCLIYDGYLMVKATVAADGMSWQEAIEWHRYNIWEGGYGHRLSPVFLNTSPYEWPAKDEDEVEE